MSLPVGTLVRLNPRTRIYDDGRSLVGGSPTRLLRLSTSARELLRDGQLRVEAGTPAVLVDRLVHLGLMDPDPDSLPAVPLDELTVVIPVRDRPAPLDRLLAALPPVREVVVVDDASLRPESVAEVVTEHGARLIALPVNRGPAAARNAGLAAVATTYVAFIDSDVVPDPDCLALLLRHFADPDLALVAPRILSSERRPVGHVDRYEAALSSLDRGPDPALVRPFSQVAWLPSACVVARTEALGDGFDERMRAGEDVDLVWRLVAAERRVRYEPRASAHHDHRTTVSGWLQRKAFYGTSAAPLASRHGAAVAPAVLSPWSTAVVLVLLSQRRWSPPVAFGIWAVATGRMARRVGDARFDAPLAASLSLQGVGAAAQQVSALALRHWWPLSIIAAVGSRRARRAILLGAIVDSEMARRRLRIRVAPIPFLIMKRADDAAYGAGVWWGAFRERSVAALLPRRQSRSGGS